MMMQEDDAWVTRLECPNVTKDEDLERPRSPLTSSVFDICLVKTVTERIIQNHHKVQLQSVGG